MISQLAMNIANDIVLTESAVSYVCPTNNRKMTLDARRIAEIIDKHLLLEKEKIETEEV